MLRVEDVACWGVVDDDCVLEISAYLAQIFDVVALVIVAAFAEQPMMHHVVYIQLVQQWIAIFRDRCGKNDNFVELAYSFQECIDTRSFYDVDVVVLTLNLNWYCEVRLMKDLGVD